MVKLDSRHRLAWLKRQDDLPPRPAGLKCWPHTPGQSRPERRNSDRVPLYPNGRGARCSGDSHVCRPADSREAAGHHQSRRRSGGPDSQILDRTDPKTGRSTLPWIKRVFDEKGTTVRNFYVRGISLSAPSWCVLEPSALCHSRECRIRSVRPTGLRLPEHVPVVTSVWTLRKRGYAGSGGARRSPAFQRPGSIILAKVVPRSQGLQLYQRGVRWSTLVSATCATGFSARHRFCSTNGRPALK